MSNFPATRARHCTVKTKEKDEQDKDTTREHQYTLFVGFYYDTVCMSSYNCCTSVLAQSQLALPELVLALIIGH